MNFTVPYIIYPNCCMFSFGQSDRELKQAMKAYGVAASDKAHKLDKTEAARTVHYDNGFTLIRMRCLPTTAEAKAVLSHEVFHAVVYLMEFVGVQLSQESNENYAYMIEYLTRSVYQRLEAVE